ncbi:hypothetical protein TICRE_07100 [Tissierella creatinophila DSM 6911]|uniref:Uncharacterized protein n=1 Tax=Tissierella creatinophila DSM 6911 TaxID=1123403 RepID=A0A1U7M7J6_TISCR|nr:hypothetical protein TICRE_07100 [Tissierella creatinophila DSM 6911]
MALGKPVKKLFLILGIALSIISKILQIGFKSIWGDILILPAATMFVLAILFYWPRYAYYLKQDSTKNIAKVFALFCCLSVLSFQIFTMISFGKKMSIGYIFIFPLLVFTCLSIYFWFYLSKEK